MALMLSPDVLDPNPDQPRSVFGEDAIAKMAESVRVHGIIQPLVIRPSGERYQIVCGERRWRAAKVAGLVEVPAVVRDIDDNDTFSTSLVENVVRESLTPADEVRAVARLVERRGVQETARLLGKSHSWVSKRKRIAEGPEFAREFLSAGISTDIEAHYELAKLADQDAGAARSIIERHEAGGHLREEVRAVARGILTDVENDGEVRRSHANGLGTEDDFRLEPRAAVAVADCADTDGGDDDEEGGNGQDGRPKLSSSWGPSAAPELDEPFDADPAVLVLVVEGRRAGHFVLTTPDGSATYRFTEKARAQLLALLAPG